VAVPRGPRSGGLRRPDKARWNWAGGVLSRRPRSGRGEASLVAADWTAASNSRRSVVV
jgi:hypothetical protein